MDNLGQFSVSLCRGACIFHCSERECMFNCKLLLALGGVRGPQEKRNGAPKHCRYSTQREISAQGQRRDADTEVLCPQNSIFCLQYMSWASSFWWSALPPWEDLFHGAPKQRCSTYQERQQWSATAHQGHERRTSFQGFQKASVNETSLNHIGLIMI